ncbi:hypothetical protein QFZ40_003705 [Arthrobacter pascens]|nr:hypothetical protein [Arthrobacter pascens]
MPPTGIDIRRRVQGRGLSRCSIPAARMHIVEKAGAMSTSNPRHSLPQPRQLRCETCGTEQHLTIHAITAMGAANGDLVTVSYTCNDCRGFQEHLAYAGDVAAALHHLPSLAKVIMFGDDYIHCGFPMEEAEFEIERLCYRSSSVGGLSTVSLPTRVLRCRCGFQLEVPE